MEAGEAGYGGGDLEVAVLVDEQVARLQVAVQHLQRRAERRVMAVGGQRVGGQRVGGQGRRSG